MDLERYFSPNYSQARKRFRDMAKKNGGLLFSEEIGQTGPNGEELSIDAARIGPSDAKKMIIVSSGTHGVEGFFGSAVQLALMDREAERLVQKNIALLLIHGVNPYGFSWLRRVNEDNVDLNRNFLLEGEDYSGADPGYAKFDPLLNPKTPPGSFEFFRTRAVWNIIKHGLPKLKNAIAQGQYDFPKGVFFGGSSPSSSKITMERSLRGWVGKAKEIIHIDLHTGLGKSGTYVMAVCGEITEEEHKRMSQYFGEDFVQSLNPDGVLYEIRGDFGAWVQAQLMDKKCLSFLAEFGTHSILRVIAALCRENRATLWAKDRPEIIEACKKELKECFAPASSEWRNKSVEGGLKVLLQAADSLQEQKSVDA